MALDRRLCVPGFHRVCLVEPGISLNETFQAAQDYQSRFFYDTPLYGGVWGDGREGAKFVTPEAT